MLFFDVPHQNGSYPIYIGCHLLNDDNLFPIPKHSKCLIISNSTIAQYHLEPVLQSLKKREITVEIYLIPDGEEYKTLNTVSEIYTSLLRHEIARDNWIIALGGGVVGDIAGFVASSYQRGIAFMQIPTTLLSQVDSSVGGKVGVNHPLGKNMIGAFYAPQTVIIDLNTLNTLPEREFYSGLGEVIKYGIALDKKFFAWLMENIPQILTREPKALGYMVEQCCRIKAEVVVNDEKERGQRALLNFGHTFAHSIETQMGYGTYLHGEAVAIGMVIASRLSMQLGLISSSEFEKIFLLLQSSHLPTSIPASMPIDAFIPLMQRDKKVANNQMRFILLQGIGQSFIHQFADLSIAEEQILQALQACYR